MNKRYVIGAIVAAIVVVGVLIGLSVAGGDDDETASAGVTGLDRVTAELDGIATDAGTLGDPAAPVKIVEYGDTSCRFCKDAAATSVPQLIERYVRPGEVSLEFRPVAFLSPSSERGALGAEAAGQQDAMWPLVQLIYANQGPEDEDWLSDARLEEFVTTLDLDVAAWREAYASEAVASAFFENDAAWRAAGGSGTPYFTIEGPRGERTLDGAVGIGEFEEAIEAVGPG